MFLAAILAILSRPLYLRLLPRLWNRADLAAGVATALVMLVIVTPLAVGTMMGAIQLSRLTQEELHNWDWSRGLNKVWTDFVEPGLVGLQQRFPEHVDVERIRQDLAGNAEGLLKSLAARTFALASSTVGTVLSLLVSGAMYYFLADGPTLVAAAESLIPVPLEHQRHLRDRFARVVRAVVMATFLAAFAQGLATAIALQVVGMRHFFIFLIAGTISALVPLAGTWMVWGPCAVWLAVQGHYTAAIGLALFGIIVVGLLDNAIRTYVLNSNAQLHPLLAFVSVLGALQVMGLWGIFFGPIIASCLYALVQIFLTELNTLSAEHATPAQDAAIPLPSAAVVAPVAPVPQSPRPGNGASEKKKHRK
jgi:predicted PurR-regulated permease PerM